jgi:thioredoxin 1
MKKTIVATFLVLSSAFYSIAKPNKPPKAAVGIQFSEISWAKALEKAKKTKKLIFLDAYASWCGPCKRMQKTLFIREDVGKFYNANFINIKKDMEVGEGPLLANSYPIEGYPTLFFIDGNGKIVGRQLGAPQTAEELIAVGKGVLKK